MIKNKFKGFCDAIVKDIPACSPAIDRTEDIVKEAVERGLITIKEQESIIVLHNNGFIFRLDMEVLYSDIENKTLGSKFNFSLNKSRNLY